MAKGIRDLTPVSEEGRHVEPDTLFEGVTGHLDHAGIYARKVRADELEAFMARDGGHIKEFVYEKVGEETGRAEQAEQTIAQEAAGGLAEESARALAAEQFLARTKTDMYVIPGPGRLMDAPVGANINNISFNTAVHPVLADSYIQCSGGELRVENDEFFFQPPAASRVVFYTGGDWTAAASGVFEAPGLTVEVNYNANGGVWENRYGSHVAGLEEVRNILHGEITAEKDRAEQEEDTIKAAIPGTAAATVAEHNTSGSAHEDIRNKILEPPAQDGSYKLQVEAGTPSYAPLTLPDAPAADGDYKLVVAGGSASWQAIS
jgi:hypothetical protein